jgi:hypothetical protein
VKGVECTSYYVEQLQAKARNGPAPRRKRQRESSSDRGKASGGIEDDRLDVNGGNSLLHPGQHDRELGGSLGETSRVGAVRNRTMSSALDALES